MTSSFSDGGDEAAPGGLLGDPNPDPAPEQFAPLSQTEPQTDPAGDFTTAEDFAALPPEVQQQLRAEAIEGQQQAEFEYYQADAAEAVVAEFPELAQEQIAQSLVEEARQQAHLLGRPDLADDPAWWREVYVSSGGPEHFARERAADAIVGAGRLGARALPF